MKIISFLINHASTIGAMIGIFLIFLACDYRFLSMLEKYGWNAITF